MTREFLPNLPILLWICMHCHFQNRFQIDFYVSGTYKLLHKLLNTPFYGCEYPPKTIIIALFCIEIIDLSTRYKHIFVLTNFRKSLAKQCNLCANIGFNYIKLFRFLKIFCKNFAETLDILKKYGIFVSI
jgi:hypothetical protein